MTLNVGHCNINSSPYTAVSINKILTDDNTGLGSSGGCLGRGLVWLDGELESLWSWSALYLHHGADRGNTERRHIGGTQGQVQSTRTQQPSHGTSHHSVPLLHKSRLRDIKLPFLSIKYRVKNFVVRPGEVAQ